MQYRAIVSMMVTILSLLDATSSLGFRNKHHPKEVNHPIHRAYKHFKRHRRQGENQEGFPEIRPEWMPAWPNPRQLDDLKNAIILTLLDRVARNFEPRLPKLAEDYIMEHQSGSSLNEGGYGREEGNGENPAEYSQYDQNYENGDYNGGGYGSSGGEVVGGGGGGAGDYYSGSKVDQSPQYVSDFESEKFHNNDLDIDDDNSIDSDVSGTTRHTRCNYISLITITMIVAISYIFVT